MDRVKHPKSSPGVRHFVAIQPARLCRDTSSSTRPRFQLAQALAHPAFCGADCAADFSAGHALVLDGQQDRLLAVRAGDGGKSRAHRPDGGPAYPWLQRRAGSGLPRRPACERDIRQHLPQFTARLWMATSLHTRPNDYVYYGNVAGQGIGLKRLAPSWPSCA